MKAFARWLRLPPKPKGLGSPPKLGMKFSRLFLAACIVLTFLPTLAQSDKKPKEREEVKGVVIRHDKFRDRKIVATKPMDFGMGTGGGKIGYIFNMSFAYVVDENKNVSPLVFIISPGGTGTLARWSESMSPEMGSGYISPDSDVIILVNGQRYKLGKVAKDYGLTAGGEWRRSAMVEIPLEVFSVVAHSDEWEMAVGPLESKIIKRVMNHFRDKFTTIESLYQKDTVENK